MPNNHRLGLDDVVGIFLSDIGMWKPRTHNERTNAYPANESCKTPNFISTLINRITMIWSGNRNCVSCKNKRAIPIIEIRNISDPTKSLSGLRFPDALLNEIGSYESQSIRFVVLPLLWIYYVIEKRYTGGHATLLIVDTISKTYCLFDPNGGKYSIKPGVSYHRQILLARSAELHGPLIPGYRGVVINQREEAIQRVVERDSRDGVGETRIPCGLCALLSVLILMCSFRFQYFDLFDVADAITREFKRRCRNRTQKESFRYRLFDWYHKTYTARQWSDLEIVLGLRNPPVPMHIPDPASWRRLCMVRSEKNGTFCAQKSCPGHAYCWVHRKIHLLERFNKRQKRCDAAVPWDSHLPKPDTVVAPPEWWMRGPAPRN